VSIFSGFVVAVIKSFVIVVVVVAVVAVVVVAVSSYYRMYLKLIFNTLFPIPDMTYNVFGGT